MIPVLVIVGPTGVGKTRLSIELAKKLNGEIINGDSMQVYKYLNIGTAKVTESEKQGVVHYLFDCKELTDTYSVADYQKDCRSVIKTIIEKGKTPIIVGGTGLYIKAALYDYRFNKEESYSFSHLTNEQLYKKLQDYCPDVSIHPNNRRRMERALTKCLSESNQDKLGHVPVFDSIVIALTTDRENLYHRINQRVLEMFEQGLLDEIRPLLPFYKTSMALKTGIGYKELEPYFNHQISLEEAISQIQKNSRHYAKRQYTFFRHQFDAKWFETNYQDFNQTIDEVYEYIKNRSK